MDQDITASKDVNQAISEGAVNQAGRDSTNIHKTTINETRDLSMCFSWLLVFVLVMNFIFTTAIITYMHLEFSGLERSFSVAQAPNKNFTNEVIR